MASQPTSFELAEVELDVGHDGHGELGELGDVFAPPLDRLTDLQPGYCPIPERTEEGPLYGYRWPDFVLNTGPEEYQTIATMEYRVPGIAAFELTLREQTAWFDDDDTFPLPSPLPLVEAPSAIARFNVVMGL